MIRVLIADSHALARKGLAQILTDGPARFIVDEAESGEETLHKACGNNYDLIVVDVLIACGEGLDVLNELKSRCPELPVLALSVFPEEHYAVRALRAGVAGLLMKEGAADELVGAINTVSAGGRYISKSLAEKLVFNLLSNCDKPRHETLSDREFEVMRMFASGKKARAIAGELSLSVKTVNTYRYRLLHKMGMKSNAELTHYAVEHNLLD
jgi:two-component system, NarL family, invasion response regulator UvrY